MERSKMQTKQSARQTSRVRIVAVCACLGVVGIFAWILHVTMPLDARATGGAEITSVEKSLVRSVDTSQTPDVEATAKVCEEATPVASKPAAVRQLVAKQIAAMPLLFVENDGQWDQTVKFAVSSHGFRAEFADRSIAMTLRSKGEHGEVNFERVALDFVGDGSTCEPTGEKRLPGVHNYLLGNDPKQWHAGVPLFESVRYDAIAPGIAIVVGDHDGRLEYDLHVAPGASLADFKVECNGISSLKIEENGTLTLETKSGRIEQSPPKAWYETSDGDVRVADCRFKVVGSSCYGFEVSNPDPSSQLLVDPGLDWSTFLGTDQDDVIYGVDFGSGTLTVVGAATTSSMVPFPVTYGAFQTNFAGGQDVFVTRFDPSQTGAAQLVWSTLLGGTGDDVALGVRVTSLGRVAVCGKTASMNYPVNNAFANTPPGAQVNAFVSFLENNGATLLYSSYFGGTNGQTIANAIASDSTPLVTIVGGTFASDMPLTAAPYDSTFDGVGDAFVARFNPALSGIPSLNYASYLGGSGGATSNDEAFAVAVESGRIFVGGATHSVGFETTSPPRWPAFDNTLQGAMDGFLLMLDPVQLPANQLLYSTFLGGTGDEQVLGLVVHNGVFHACGWTTSGDFPIGSDDDSFGPFDQSQNNGLDAFVTKLNPAAANQLAYSTFLGGTGDDIAYSIARVQDRSDLVVGRTTSTDFPIGAIGGATPYDPSFNGVRDAFVTRLTWKGNRGPPNQLEYSTYLGGVFEDEARSVVLDGSLDVYLGGWTQSYNFPTTTNAFDTTFNSGTSYGDAFASMLTLPPVTP